jgi:hypothetical protein
MKRNELIFLILVMVICVDVTFIAINDSIAASQVEMIYTIGNTNTYRIIFPKQGRIGAPVSPSAIPDAMQPISEEDYETRFIKVTIISDRVHANIPRKVMKIDEVDAKGNVLVRDLYYAYYDIYADGIQIICRDRDDNRNQEETGIRFGIPFPFYCAQPPVLGFKKENREGYVASSTGIGIQYLKKNTIEGSGVIDVEAMRFENDKLSTVHSPSVRWYKSDIENAVMDSDTKVIFLEQQKWVDSNKWLWKEMKRFDKDGNLLMRCELIP